MSMQFGRQQTFIKYKNEIYKFLCLIYFTFSFYFLLSSLFLTFFILCSCFPKFSLFLKTCTEITQITVLTKIFKIVNSEFQISFIILSERLFLLHYIRCFRNNSVACLVIFILLFTLLFYFYLRKLII